ncbi:MAG: transcriptional regulator, partial [Methylocystaceae bacterium]|nr:transcriptional regulator [Methylocystaceae bacterium]
EAFKLLVAYEPDGLPAGSIADALAVPHNTLSTHLSILSRAHLVSAKRYSRSVVYRANLTQLQQLISYFLTDCCGGKPELCAPLLVDLSPSCSSKKTTEAI